MQQQIEEGVVSLHLVAVKATLLSMLLLFVPFHHHNENTLNLTRQCTEVMTCIAKLIEQEEMFPLVEDVLELEEWALCH